MRAERVSGVGIGFRAENAADLFAAPETVDFVEVVAETCFTQSDTRREVLAAAEVWPIVPHGVKLSLGSASGIDDAHAKKLGALAREVRASVVSEHVAMTRSRSREVGHLTAIPLTLEMVEVVRRNVERARRFLPDVPFLLENIAWTVRWPDDAMNEGEFYTSIVRATGCGLLLDVANLYANAVNEGRDPVRVLDEFPIDDVQMIHVAGGIFEDAFYFDTHAHAIPEAVFALLERVIAQRGDVPMLIERDSNFPTFAETRVELERLRAIAAGAERNSTPSPRSVSGEVLRSTPSEEIAHRQERLAELLTDTHAETDTFGFDSDAIARTRSVLLHKRVDDAMPLLSRLSIQRERVTAIATAQVHRWARGEENVGVADALRIAEAAAKEPQLEPLALYDRLLLRARFVGPMADGGVKPRVGPFVGRERIGGKTVWAVKGPGATARVRVFERTG